MNNKIAKGTSKDVQLIFWLGWRIKLYIGGCYGSSNTVTSCRCHSG